MSNWKIGWRITAGFASVILIAVCLGMFAYRATVGIQLNGNALTKDFLPSSASLSHIQADSFRKTNLLLLHSRTSSQAEMDALEERMKPLTEDANVSLAAYDATESTPEEKVLYQKVKESRTQFLTTFEEVRKLSRIGTAAANKRANDLIAESLVPQLDAYSSATQVLLDYDMKSSLDGLKQVNLAVDSAKSGIIIGLAIATILAALVTFVIVRSITGPLAMAVTTLRQMADCDMTARLEIHTKDEVGEMAAALNSAVDRLRGTLREVASSARSANTSSQELASAADSIASGAQEQAASLEETSASLEEITATVRQSADNARHANQLATASKESAQLGMQVVTDAVGAMREINAASSQIAQIIATIDEIAFQTNLLAVNAAVEAARAGDQGRGFAVVASEVRSLAQRSAGAAKEIKALIQDSLGKVERGSELVNRSGTTLESIIGSVQRVTDIVGEISSASAEQTTGIEQVSTAVLQIDQVTQANSSQTEELAATANALSDQSLRLTGLVEVFRLGDEVPGGIGNLAPIPQRPATRPAVAKTGKKLRVERPLAATARFKPAAAGADGGSFVEF